MLLLNSSRLCHPLGGHSLRISRCLGTASSTKVASVTKVKKKTKKEQLVIENANRLYILDGTALLFKAYYAGIAFKRHKLAKKSSRRSFGASENALLTIATSHFSRFLEEVKPLHLAVVFDHGKKTFRNELYPEYKQQRKGTPLELSEALRCIMPTIQDMGAACYSVSGFEADDVMASIGHWARQRWVLLCCAVLCCAVL
jgi:hypothetical protein